MKINDLVTYLPNDLLVRCLAFSKDKAMVQFPANNVEWVNIKLLSDGS